MSPMEFSLAKNMDDFSLASPEYGLKWVQIFYNNKSALKFYS